MTAPSARPRQPPRLMGLLNVPMRALLRLPFATPLSAQLMLLSFTGRKTGKRYLQPVSYVRDGDTLLTPGGGKWKLNLQDGRPIRIYLQGRAVQARPEIIGDPETVARLLGQMAASNPRVTSYVPIVGTDGQIDPSRVTAAVQHGFRIIRWHLDQGQSV
jgi:hypothetical protein